MPVTFPAHQAVVLPIKLKWPDRVDATAMCVGAAAPDLGYPLLGIRSHSVAGALAFALPFTLVACAALRWRAASGVFGNLPDSGAFRIHSYRVLARRRPPLRVTILSAVIGVASHIVIDAFTHTDRWGSELLGLDRVLFTAPVRGEMTGARVVQYLGHSIGSMVAVAVFFHIGRHRLLERWYGVDPVHAARRFETSLARRVAFWSITGAITVLTTLAIRMTNGQLDAFSPILGGTIGLLVAGCLSSTGVWRAR